MKGAAYVGKRGVDLAVGLVATAAAAPVMGIVAVLIWLRMGRPILFRQVRLGRFEEHFVVYKFRTMVPEPAGGTATDVERLTGLGRFLRRTSLDELPQLFNVLNGTMSLVGPRPLLLRYQPFFTDEERIRFAVRPGLTGWAQIKGRNLLGWTDRLALDAWYVRNWSLRLDLAIIVRTIPRLLSASGVLDDVHSIGQDLDVERA